MLGWCTNVSGWSGLAESSMLGGDWIGGILRAFYGMGLACSSF